MSSKHCDWIISIILHNPNWLKYIILLHLIFWTQNSICSYATRVIFKIFFFISQKILEPFHKKNSGRYLRRRLADMNTRILNLRVSWHFILLNIVVWDFSSAVCPCMRVCVCICMFVCVRLCFLHLAIILLQFDFKTIGLHILYLIRAFCQLFHYCFLVRIGMQIDFTLYCVWMHYFLIIDTKCTNCHVFFQLFLCTILISFLVIYSFIYVLIYSFFLLIIPWFSTY